MFECHRDNDLKISDHDMVFWMGDLNYRIEGLSNEKIKTLLLQDEGIDVLINCDQLRRQKNLGNVFAGSRKISWKPRLSGSS